MNRLTLALCRATALVLVDWGAAPPAGAAPPPGKSHRPVCPGAASGHGRCFAHVVTDSTGVPLTSSAPPAGGYGPAQFHGGYNPPCSVGGDSGPGLFGAPPRVWGPSDGVLGAL